MPGVAAADLERSFSTTHATLTLAIFLVPGMIALVVEPILFLLADRYPRRWFLRGGVATMGVGVWLAALAPGPIVFTLALSMVAFASGTACAIAQATLVDRFADQRGRALARWSLWSLAGDLAAPGLGAVLSFAGASWRTAFLIVGALLLLWTLAVTASDDHDRATQPREESPPLLATLKAVLADHVLIAWLFGMTLCDLLDEILVVFASIHLRMDLHASPLWQSATVAALVIGGALGLLACDRLLKLRSERWVLVASAIGCAASYVPWLAAPTPLLSMLLMLPVGACVAPLYPLAAAQAYARQPEASGAVLAAGHLFTPLALALPFLVGSVADHAGTLAALALLLLQPLGLVVLVGTTRR